MWSGEQSEGGRRCIFLPLGEQMVLRGLALIHVVLRAMLSCTSRFLSPASRSAVQANACEFWIQLRNPPFPLWPWSEHVSRCFRRDSGMPRKLTGWWGVTDIGEKEHSVMYPVDLLKVCALRSHWSRLDNN